MYQRSALSSREGARPTSSRTTSKFSSVARTVPRRLDREERGGAGPKRFSDPLRLPAPRASVQNLDDGRGCAGSSWTGRIYTPPEDISSILFRIGYASVCCDRLRLMPNGRECRCYSARCTISYRVGPSISQRLVSGLSPPIKLREQGCSVPSCR